MPRSCDAPRAARHRKRARSSCRFCGADFTLDDRDLDTVCPKCMARISDRAKFCHHCGARVAAESVAGEKTRLVCPACGGRHYLSGRRVEEVPVLECGQCAGLWLGDEAFRQVTEKAAAEAIDAESHFSPRQAPPTLPPGANRQAERYRKCPFCGEMMNRRNYASRSGVIVDVCRQHGVWFDADELPRIIAWIRAGSLAQANRDWRPKPPTVRRWKKPARKPIAKPPGSAATIILPSPTASAACWQRRFSLSSGREGGKGEWRLGIGDWPKRLRLSMSCGLRYRRFYHGRQIRRFPLAGGKRAANNETAVGADPACSRLTRPSAAARAQRTVAV